MTERARKLLIGLSPRLLREVPQELGFRGKTLQYLEQSMAHWVMSLGALVVMVPTVERESLIRRAHIDIGDYVAALDGLILQGGADVDPKTLWRNGVEHGRPGRRDARSFRARSAARLRRGRQAGIRRVPRHAADQRGACGGSLHQDLCADGATTNWHAHSDAYDQHAHPLAIVPDSWLSKRYDGATAGVVNSIHHQGIERLGRDLTIEAHADDGVIEAIRGTGEGFLLGVQWHPEFHDGSDPRLLPADPLMQAFLEAAAEYRDAEVGE